MCEVVDRSHPVLIPELIAMLHSAVLYDIRLNGCHNWFGKGLGQLHKHFDSSEEFAKLLHPLAYQYTWRYQFLHARCWFLHTGLVEISDVYFLLRGIRMKFLNVP
jgi:hypothetical protein